MSFNPLLLLNSAWAADDVPQTTSAMPDIDINSYCTPDVPLGFPTETVAIFLGAFVFSLIIDLMQHKNSKEITFMSSVVWQTHDFSKNHKINCISE